MNQKSNDISNLYDVLLETVTGVKDGSVDIEKAKAIAEVGQVIVNAGKLECEYLKLAEKTKSNFLSDKYAELDASLKEIEERRKAPYQPTPKSINQTNS